MTRPLLIIGLLVLVVGAASLAISDYPVRRRAVRLYDGWTARVPSSLTHPLAAEFNDPSGIWIDSQGVVFFSERRTHVVRALAADKLMTIAGNGRRGYTGDDVVASDARLNFPEGLVGDEAGNIYIADSKNHRIRRVDAGGLITTVAGTGRPGFSGDDGPAVAARLHAPMDVALGPSGALYICDFKNSRIRRMAPDGMISTVAGNGEAGYAGDGGPATQASLNEPYGIWVDENENLLIADSSNHRLRRVDSSGLIHTIAGTGVAGFDGDGGFAIEARLDSPQAVVTLPSGEIVINDEHNHRIRVIGVEGELRTIAGNGKIDLCGDGGLASHACLNDPEGIMFDAQGRLWLTDGDNHRLRRIDRDGIIRTVAGSGPPGKKG